MSSTQHIEGVRVKTWETPAKHHALAWGVTETQLIPLRNALQAEGYTAAIENFVVGIYCLSAEKEKQA